MRQLRIADRGSRIADCLGNVFLVNAEEFKRRTKSYGLRVIKLVESLPNSTAGRVLGNQLLRSGTSVGANYRAAARAKSRADLISKMGTVEEECDESIYWMELILEDGLVKEGRLNELMAEGEEILAMVVSSICTARAKGRS